MISTDGLYFEIYLRVSTLTASPLFVCTEKLLYSVVVTSGLDLDDTGRALGSQLKISNNNNNVRWYITYLLFQET